MQENEDDKRVRLRALLREKRSSRSRGVQRQVPEATLFACAGDNPDANKLVLNVLKGKSVAKPSKPRAKEEEEEEDEEEAPPPSV